MHQPGRATVQEIGYFAAHRHERDKGISLTRANDILTSARLWHQQFNLTKLTTDNLKAAGRANFRIMPDERINERLGLSRQTADQSFNPRSDERRVGQACVRPVQLRGSSCT